MSDRILDLSEEPARLSVKYAQLVISRDGAEQATVPLSDMAVLVVSHPEVTFTQAVLTGLVDAGGGFVLCNERRLPVGMVLPLDAHYIQAERFTAQARAPLPIRKRLWSQIVAAKVRAQGQLLEHLYGDDGGICGLAARIKSGDPSNIEAQASRRYWPLVFADPSFRRVRTAQDQNRLLNYGYAILRAVVARAACAAGLHPSLGLHHSNRYNAFCLADDLMEPLRPVVDAAVERVARERGVTCPLDREAKTVLLEAITSRIDCDGESRTLFDAVSRTASSLVAVFDGTRKNLVLPEVDFAASAG